MSQSILKQKKIQKISSIINPPSKDMPPKIRPPKPSQKPPPSPVHSSDDSEDEQLLIKTGRVPRQWYDDYKHLGYDISANTVLKAQQDTKIDEIIRKSEDPNWWKIVRDELNNKEIVLTDKQLDLLQRIRCSKFADPAISTNDVIFT